MDLKVLGHYSDGDTEVTLTADDLSKLEGKELERIVDKDLAAFDEFFQNRVENSPLRPEEKALLKTYLYFKTHPEG